MHKFTTVGLIGKFATADDETLVQANRTDLTKKDFQDAAFDVANRWRSRYKNLLSCFELEGEYGLYNTIGAFVTEKAPLDAELKATAGAGDMDALRSVYFRSFCVAFITLFDKGALKRLLLVHKFASEAWAEYTAMLSIAALANPEAPAPEVKHTEPAAPVETPEETCVREFRELPSPAWKAKWLDNSANRAVADRCAGRL